MLPEQPMLSVSISFIRLVKIVCLLASEGPILSSGLPGRHRTQAGSWLTRPSSCSRSFLRLCRLARHLSMCARAAPQPSCLMLLVVCFLPLTRKPSIIFGVNTTPCAGLLRIDLPTAQAPAMTLLRLLRQHCTGTILARPALPIIKVIVMLLSIHNPLAFASATPGLPDSRRMPIHHMSTVVCVFFIMPAWSRCVIYSSVWPCAPALTGLGWAGVGVGWVPEDSSAVCRYG